VNHVDLLILLVIAVSAVVGARRGVVGAGGEVAAVGVGLGGASFGYPIFGAVFAWLGIPDPLAPLLGFLTFAIALVLVVGWVTGVLARRLRLPATADKVGGAGLGVVMGIMLASAAVLISGAVTRSAVSIQQSRLGMPVVGLVPRLHEAAERIGVPLPKLVQLPQDYRDELSGARQGVQFLRFNATKLTGATCLHCRTPVRFEGYQFVRGTLMSPRFRCPRCGRTSEGCQTFEGFHAIYDVCPVDSAKEGILFDCGVWANGWWTVPHGACPVCGKAYTGTNLGAVDRGEVPREGP